MARIDGEQLEDLKSAIETAQEAVVEAIEKSADRVAELLMRVVALLEQGAR